MKTKLVRPILLDSEEWQPLVLSTSRYGGLFKSEYYNPMTEMGDTYKELIFVSLDPDERIEIGDIIYHSLDYCTLLVTDSPQYDNKEMLKEYGYKKVITTYSQLSPELIQKLIDEYNNGGMKDFEIEMCLYYKDLSGEHEAYLAMPTDYYKPKLTNGFITPIIKEEKLYTKDDLKDAFWAGGYDGWDFDEWFERTF